MSFLIPSGLNETIKLGSIENLDQNMDPGTFYGVFNSVGVGKYNRIRCLIDDNQAGAGESCTIRFGIYDRNFDLIDQTSQVVDNTFVTPNELIMSYDRIIRYAPIDAILLFGRNDQVGNFTLQSARQDQSGGTISPGLIFTYSLPAGPLPANISVGRVSGSRIFYTSLFNID